ncbi:MAG: FAD-dependent oxidoreductase [Vulcanimicrobiaceae bacterium]
MMSSASGQCRTVGVAIIGSGPCGLGAAWRLSERSPDARPSFVVVDRNVRAGGSASSFTTTEGFTFDLGGHVLYPHDHYSKFKSLLDDIVPEWYESKPIRGVWMDRRLIPYPVQRNLHRLPVWKLLGALFGLIGVRVRDIARPQIDPDIGDLERYLQYHFGRGLTRDVLGPLNRKMWAHEPSELGSEWTSHRSGSNTPNVTDARVRELLRSIVTRRDNPGWTDSTRVRYPARGGTGSIWTALGDRFKEHVMDGEDVTGIDERTKVIRFASGLRIRYERLISTLPLDVLIALLDYNEDIAAFGAQLRYAQAGFVGFGFRGAPPPVLRGVHSFHLPQSDIPCWRVTIPSNVAPGNAPCGDYWSMLCELSVPAGVEVDLSATSETILRKLRAYGLVPDASELVSRWSSSMQHGYPVPFIGRDAILRRINTALLERDILSRGRFGGWKYEVSNQDHTFMQGVEAVDYFMTRRAEETYSFAEAVV